MGDIVAPGAGEFRFLTGVGIRDGDVMFAFLTIEDTGDAVSAAGAPPKLNSVDVDRLSMT